MLPLTASLVVYRSPVAELTALLEGLASAHLVRWIVVDNGACEERAQGWPERSAELRETVERLGGLYVETSANVGFGAGHNLALRGLAGSPAEFHLLVNPDIEFGPEALPALVAAMEQRPSAAMMMPRVVYQDGEFQPLCKLLPTPLDFALRRFAPRWVQRRFQGRLDRYEMTGVEWVECNRVPFLSGCFLFTRRALLEQAGGFDDRYFLYMEDVDLSRRMARLGDVVYWPGTTVVHGCFRGAYRSRKLMFFFLQSAWRYFHRWGWMFDRERTRANRTALECLQSK